MKQLARNYTDWKSIDKDIESIVRESAACASTRNSPPKASLHPGGNRKATGIPLITLYHSKTITFYSLSG